MALEIRVLDVQECPRMDLAIAEATVAVSQALVEETWAPLADQRAWHETELEKILLSTIADADDATIDDARYLEAFGLTGTRSIRAGELWQHLIETQVETRPAYASAGEALRIILREGCLARRITRATGPDPSPASLREVYLQLADCLARGQAFSSPP
jgi:hypothetical protein